MSPTSPHNPEQPWRLTVPADLSRVAEVRAWLGEVGARASLSETRIFDLQVAASEATANGIEHAASGVELAAWVLSDRLMVEITNDGVFQPGLVKSGDSRRRGLGLPLMVSLADQVHVSRLASGKTKVTITFFTAGAVDSEYFPTSPVRSGGGQASLAGDRSRGRLLGWLFLAPVPLLIIAVGILYALNADAASESAVLSTALGTLFVTAASVVIAYSAARTYLGGGSRAMLALGTGAASLGLAYLLAGPLVTSLNAAVTAHNSLFFVAGVLFATSGVLILRQRAPEARVADGSGVLLAYGGVVALAVLLPILARLDLFPDFYVRGVGYTAWRTTVLGLGVAGFIVASVCFGAIHRTRPSWFALLAGSASALFAVSLGASVLTRAAAGSPISWVLRAGTCIGGLYLLFGVLSVGYGRSWLLPLERSLHESEERYRALVDLSPDAILVQSGSRLLFANPAAAKLLAFPSAKKLIGKDVDELLAPATRETALQRIGETYAGAVTRSEEEMLMRADGSLVDVSVVRGRIEFGGRLAVQTIARDITERKRAEQSLRESERRFRDLYENSVVGFFETSADGRVVAANQTCADIFGYADAESMVAEVEDVAAQLYSHPEDRKMVLGAADTVQSSTHSSVEVRVKRRDGAARWVQLDVRPLHGPGIATGYRGSVTDITDRKRAEDELRHKEQEARHLIRHAPTAVYEIDFRGPRFISVNDVMCELSGYSREELLASSPMDLLQQESRVRFGERIRKALAGEAPADVVEYQVKGKDGREIWAVLNVSLIYEEGGPVRALVVGHDVTERKRAEQAVSDSQKKYQALIETNTDFVWETDAQGRYTYCSPQMERLWGINPAEMLGKTPFDLMPPEAREAGIAFYEKVIASAAPFRGVEVVSHDGNSQLIDVEISGVPFFDEAGRVLGLRGTSRDVTERKRAERERERLRSEQQQLMVELAASNKELQQQTEELAAREGQLQAQNEELRTSQYNRSLIEAALDPLVSIGPDGKITDVNQATIKITGHRREELIGTDFSEYFTDAERARRGYQEVFATGAVTDYPLTIRARDGKLTDVLYNASVYKDPAGDVIGVFAAARDVSAVNELNEQRDIARILQEALLDIPQELPGLKLGHLYRSATRAAQVGGDFYDVFAAKDGKVAILIGDVAGHGIEAARTATLVKDVAHAFIHQSLRPHQVLRRTNGLLVEKDLKGFVAVFLGILDTDTGQLRYASAGHPDTLLRRASGKVEHLGGGSSPLGIYPDATWKPHEVDLEADDLLVLYTDGVIEARRNGELFGEKRLEALIKRKRFSPQRLPHLILDQVFAFSEGSLQDDVAILTLLLTAKGDGADSKGPFTQEKLLD